MNDGDADERAHAARELGTLIRKLPQRYEPDVEIATLEDWPGNPKDHDLGAIMHSMQEIGVYGALRVQESSRRILAGHGTRQALTQLGVTTMAVLWIDCNDRDGARIVAADNRLAQLGGYNDPALLDYLVALYKDDNLVGTGYDADDIETLYAQVHGDEKQPADRESSPATVTCPACGHVFEAER